MPAITDAHAARHAGESFAETVTRFRRTRAELIELGDALEADEHLGGRRLQRANRRPRQLDGEHGWARTKCRSRPTATPTWAGNWSRRPTHSPVCRRVRKKIPGIPQIPPGPADAGLGRGM
jgi:hypothetical protein